MATPSPALPRIRSMDADGKRAWRVGRARRDRDDGHSRNSERTTCCSALSAWRRSCHGGGRGSRTRPGRTTATSRCASPSLLLHAHSPFVCTPTHIRLANNSGLRHVHLHSLIRIANCMCCVSGCDICQPRARAKTTGTWCEHFQPVLCIGHMSSTAGPLSSAPHLF